MQKVAIYLSLLLALSCGTPNNGGSIGPAPINPPTSDGGASKPPAPQPSPGRPVAVAYSIDDWAKILGVHPDIVLIGNMGCARLLNCGWEVDIPSECAAAMIRVWCSGEYKCTEPVFADPNNWHQDECTIDSWDKSACSKLDEPLQCEFLQSRGLDFRLTAGAPPDGWPPLDENSTMKWPGTD